MSDKGMGSKQLIAEYKVTVVGGGSFGSALADIVAANKFSVRQWMRSQSQADEVNQHHTNTRYLPDYPLHPAIEATTGLAYALEGSDVILVAIPSKSFRTVVRQMRPFVQQQMVVSTTKGIEADSFKLMSQILEEELPTATVGVISGPNLAKEIVAKALTATVVASDSDVLSQTLQKLLHTDYFRVYSSTDRYGVELGGALKNIYAIVCGMGNALNMGANTQSMLMTRALAEMSRFAVMLGANPLTFLGLAGVGDLIVTCTSPLSRNFRVGYAVGKGKSLDDAEAELGQVAEGVNTLRLVKTKADELGVYMPIVQGLYAILEEQKPIARVIRQLMLGEQKDDVEFILHS
ncbi:NAD(P)H-dependent glycerol-3-phosphate dehydrogenase [Zooshikella harenae]|nr:NAD(P)H-dependent glycerol-3-phosphate dehydrogenase [Zooshikella harenae]